MYFVVTVFTLIMQFRNFELFMVCFTIFYIIIFSPTIILHYTYYLQAKGIKIEFSEDGLMVFEGNTLKTIKDEDIIKIELYMSQSYAKTGYSTGRYPGEDYYYAIIITHSGEIIINNLLYPKLLNIDRYLNLSKFEYITRIFAFLP
ncbi:hypothetical protein [Pedobacter sp. AJM]|uniref:hypothetical protein n=1 Tax=Pedobacter sp. AJM TaxID=2003629 RepID=UPI000B4A8F3B|nr:hypothetical protein [Pedobacter sp. AJM]